MLKSLSLKSKLLVLCLMLSTVSVIVGVSNFRNSKRVISEYDLVTSQNMPKLDRVNQMFLEFRSLRIALRTLGYENLPADIAKTSLDKVHASIATFEQLAKGYGDQPFAPGEEAIYKNLMSSWKQFHALGGRILSRYASKDPADRKEMIRMFLYDCPEHAEAFLKEAGALTRFHEHLAAARIESAQGEAKQANVISLALILGGTLFGLAFGYWLSTSIAKELRGIADGLMYEASEVSKVASQITIASEDLSTATNQQTTALQETSSAIAETSAMISKNADNATTSSTVSQESERSVERGRRAVEAVVQSIQEISRSNNDIMVQIEESNREISDIVRVIAEIESKTKVINDIVFQTKLLSFNASVEAARAGEHGKGFAVVAEEVGKLAQMSGNSAKEISDMLDGSIKKVEQIVAKTQTRVTGLVQSAKEKVQVGTSTAENCNQILEEIVANVARVGSLVSEISDASQEQSKGVSEISRAMHELDAVAQRNSVAADETSKSAETLQSQVHAVRMIVGNLNGVLNGAKGAVVDTVPNRNEAAEFPVQISPAWSKAA